MALSNTDQRPLRRVVILAYGGAGLEWLNSVGHTLEADALMRELRSCGMLQLWAVGAEGEGHDFVEVVDGNASPAELQRRLERGAHASNRGRFPQADFTAVVVFERWPMFENPFALRRSLRTSAALASRIQTDPSAPPAFDYDWFSLIDCTSAPLRGSDAKESLLALTPDSINDHPLVVDAVDSRGGVIDRNLADAVFRHLVVAAATSDIVQRSPGSFAGALFSGASRPGVCPISIAVLHHDKVQASDAFSDAVIECLLTQPITVPTSEDGTMDLAHLPSREATEIAQGTFSTRSARHRRAGSATDLLTKSFISRDEDRCAISVSAVRRAVQMAFKAPTDALEPAALPIVAGLGTMPITLLAGVAMTAVIAGATFFSYRRRKTSLPVSPASQIERPTGVIEEWDRLCDGLEVLCANWIRSARSQRSRSERTGMWATRSGSAYEWDLVPRPAGSSSPTTVLARRDYTRLAKHCITLILEGANAEGIFVQAIRRFSADELDTEPERKRLILQAALVAPQVEDLIQRIRRLPLLIGGAGAPHQDIIWVTNPENQIESKLAELEAPGDRSLVRFVATDDASRSTRIAIGAPITWDNVPTVALLRTRT